MPAANGMDTWPREELGRIGTAEEIGLASRRPDGTRAEHEIVFLPRLPRGKPFGSLAGVVSAERLNRISPLSTAMLKTAWIFDALP